MGSTSVTVSVWTIAAGLVWLLGVTLVLVGIAIDYEKTSRACWMLAMICEGMAVCLTVRVFLNQYAATVQAAYKLGRESIAGRETNVHRMP